MFCTVVALVVLLAGGLMALVAGRHARPAALLGVTAAVGGGAAILVEAVAVLAGRQPEAIQLPWDVPLGSFSIAMDPLSAVFAAAIGLVTALAAVYGGAYLRSHDGRKNLGGTWFFFNLLTASMLLVVVARNAVLFLVAWELMSLASFFLVMFQAERRDVRRAGWIYLAAMHLGTACVVAVFLLLGRGAGTLDFDRFAAGEGMAGVIFVLAVIGFGTKAGFIPLHVWLPEAHPAAPSHVSAVMSGVMIKTGIYGLLRTLTWLGAPPPWWGWTLVAIGSLSALLGVLYALAEKDLKRLLAYCSVENVGIISLGFGVGMLGISYRSPTMAALGFAGGLLHVLNHAVFKSLFFLGAGAVLHATGLKDLDRLGGLLRRMPVTGATFLVGAAAISGLPPLNGFVSEWMIYLGAAAGAGGAAHPASAAWTLLGVAVAGSLALSGGLAAATFTKAVGMVFLGEPRTAEAAAAHEAAPAMRGPMLVLAALCLLIGLSAPLWPLALRPAVAVLVPESMQVAAATAMADAAMPLAAVALGGGIVLGLVVVLVQVRFRLLAGRRVEQAVTWDCGYVAPAARMQYTASSFARPLTLVFRLFLRSHDEIDAPEGLFPRVARLRTHTPDAFRRRLYEPLVAGIGWLAGKFRWLQQGRIQLYVLYIALTILLLIIWKLG